MIDAPLKAAGQAANTIFLLGEMTAGKDYVGQVLINIGYTRIAFADALKEEVAAMHNITVAELNANKAKYRKELQAHGAARRRENINYWVDRFDEKMKLANKPVVCTDTRHINEATYGIRDVENALVVRIWTPWAVRMERIKRLYGEVPPELHEHPSETEVPMCPFNIHLPGTYGLRETELALFLAYENWVALEKPIYKQVSHLKMR